VLPRQLLQDYCSLNGDCDICGRTTNGKYKSCHLNGDERTDGEDSDDECEDDDDEGAVGGDEELLMEVTADSLNGNTTFYTPMLCSRGEFLSLKNIVLSVISVALRRVARES
jgi:hypothetical protein